MKQTILFLLMLSLLVACNSIDSSDLIMEEQSNLKIEKLTGVQKDILVDVIANKYGIYKKNNPQTRSLSDIEISPLVIDGDTMMYLAQID